MSTTETKMKATYKRVGGYWHLRAAVPQHVRWVVDEVRSKLLDMTWNERVTASYDEEVRS